MTLRRQWHVFSRSRLGGSILVGIGLLLIALTPLVGPIPGPGGVIVFAGGLSLVLKYSGWAKRLYVRLKRRHPKKGAWADWSLRRQSARRRDALIKERRLAEEAAGPVPSDADAKAEAARR